jgi:Fe-Mn family superoxide dismutase
MTHKLPPLPYDYSALEPHIDTRTMAVHHDKHHQAYVNNLNKALENYPDLQHAATLQLLSDLNSVPEAIRLAVRNHGGGHANHSMFWNAMHSSGGGEPSGKLGDAISESFGSFEAFKDAFSKTAATLFGVGWTWLCMDGEGKLLVITTHNQDNPVSQGLIPLLGLDVWEHAYYLKYENRRADYIAAWWNVVNWSYVSANLTVANLELGVRDVASWAGETWSKVTAAFSGSSDD